MKPVKIVATIMLKDAHREALLAEMKPLVAGSRAEAGCLRYDLHQDIQNPNRVVVFEIWKSQAAVDEHNASTHFQAFVKAIEGKVDSVDIAVLTDVSENRAD
ncbi:MAG: putative quinol monooxygenase [Lautropia sp.]|nr:putative quinol monooxygenase [Lautropia sp.]